jgi:hypothetical protein
MATPPIEGMNRNGFYDLLANRIASIVLKFLSKQEKIGMLLKKKWQYRGGGV